MIRRFLLSTHGVVGVIVALVMPILIGGLGLGAETAYWYVLQRRLQHAADISAYAAANQLRAGGDDAALTAAARYVADRAGAAEAALALDAPPVSGALAGDPASVEVELSESRGRLFSRLFIVEPVTLRGRAVARMFDQSRACVLALSPTASGALTTGGSATVRLNGCDIASNSNAPDAFDMVGGAVRVEAGCASTVGEADVTGGLILECGGVSELSPPIADPYAHLPEPEIVGPCESASGGGAVSLTPTYDHPSGMKSMRFCGDLRLNNDIALSSGLYIIEGDLIVNSNGFFTGEGVTLFVTGEIRMNGTPTMDLEAPSTGPYAGVLFMGARASTDVSHLINGNAGSSLDGALYFPSSHLTMSGNLSAAGGCVQIVAETVEFTGNSTFDITCTATEGEEIVSRRIALAE